MMTANKWVCSEDSRIPCTTPLEATGAKPGIYKKKKKLLSLLYIVTVQVKTNDGVINSYALLTASLMAA